MRKKKRAVKPITSAGLYRDLRADGVFEQVNALVREAAMHRAAYTRCMKAALEKLKGEF
jgi:hypothetical protein